MAAMKVKVVNEEEKDKLYEVIESDDIILPRPGAFITEDDLCDYRGLNIRLSIVR